MDWKVEHVYGWRNGPTDFVAWSETLGKHAFFRHVGGTPNDRLFKSDVDDLNGEQHPQYVYERDFDWTHSTNLV